LKAIRIHTPGGLLALRLEEIPVPEPGPGQVLVHVEAAGVNFIDVYHRTGFYKIPTPFTLGQEGAGVVERAGDGVDDFRPGDRVAWASVPAAYAEYCLVPAARLVPVPDDVTTRDAAAAMLQGMTAHYLACSTYPLKPGDTCLVHAGAGGVGGLLVQVALFRGARVIATVGSAEKVRIVREAGVLDVILYREADVVAEVKRITGGKLCQVVYDGVGRDTFQASLACTAPRGLLAAYGQASGGVGPVDPLILMDGSKYLTRAKLADYIATREELLARGKQVLGWIGAGKLKLRIYKEYPLADAAAAHRDLEGRGTTGKLILRPG
jgi:NADPH2:quinone reductase